MGGLATRLVAAEGIKALNALMLVGKVCRGVHRYGKKRMPRIPRKTKKKSTIMGREVGSTQQRSMTNPTNCGTAHFQALPIPNLTIRHPRMPLKGLRSLVTVYVQHFASHFDAVGGKYVKCLGR